MKLTNITKNYTIYVKKSTICVYNSIFARPYVEAAESLKRTVCNLGKKIGHEH